MTQSKPRLTARDLEKVQGAFPDYRMELVGGEITVMSPCGIESDEVAVEITRQLANWVRPRKLGRVIGSSGGYKLPNQDEDVRAPDVSFIRAERMPHTTRNYSRVVPDLMFEVVSKTDSAKKLRAKINQFLELGTQVGVLVDPRTSTMEVYGKKTEEILHNGDVFILPEMLIGWEMEVASIWAPDFETEEESK